MVITLSHLRYVGTCERSHPVGLRLGAVTNSNSVDGNGECVVCVPIESRAAIFKRRLLLLRCQDGREGWAKAFRSLGDKTENQRSKKETLREKRHGTTSRLSAKVAN